MSEKTENINREGLTLVLQRNAFYRDNYRRAVFALIIVFFINILLAASIIYRYINPPEPQYFATNAAYQLIKWHPLTDPVVSNNYVLQWATNAVHEAFSLDFIHWREQLQRASNNFTPSGWHWFLSAFKQSGDLDTLVNLSMVSDATVTGAPVMQYEGVLGGRYIWKIEMPIMITFTNKEKTIPLPLKITLIAQREAVQDYPSQIAINQFLPVVQSE
ncbi:MAG: type IV secretion protein IcmL [Gammaproteobacteria bacterium RIFCSPHIGHO2_12_FULL_38_11]|nr:MAG: type IV secretion protein IcmL [Gammaproteobacteria bacterium RIFCSPHIGHO2_12_FULL_38_11]